MFFIWSTSHLLVSGCLLQCESWHEDTLVLSDSLYHRQVNPKNVLCFGDCRQSGSHVHGSCLNRVLYLSHSVCCHNTYLYSPNLQHYNVDEMVTGQWKGDLYLFPSFFSSVYQYEGMNGCINLASIVIHLRTSLTNQQLAKESFFSDSNMTNLRFYVKVRPL